MASVSEQAATPGMERHTRGSSAIWRLRRQIAEEPGFSGGPFPAEALRLPPANSFNPFGIFIDDVIFPNFPARDRFNSPVFGAGPSWSLTFETRRIPNVLGDKAANKRSGLTVPSSQLPITLNE